MGLGSRSRENGELGGVKRAVVEPDVVDSDRAPGGR